MYNSKIGPNRTRVPNSEWAGCGFSKTHLNLFPVDDKNKDKQTNEDVTVTENATGQNINDSGDAASGQTTGKRGQRTNFELGPHQQSNLLDFGGPRHSSAPPKDLSTLFIQNQLEKYIGEKFSHINDVLYFLSL